MSLLLDALKKAADDKQKASQAGASTYEQVNEEKVGAATDAEINLPEEELSLQPTSNSQSIPEASLINNTEDSTELTLDVDESDTDELTPDESVSAHNSDLENSGVEKNKKGRDSGADEFTVSGDALSMLIYKTNRDVKRSRKILLFSILIASLVIIVSGGIYYYLDMQAEIAALERRHQIAMQSMESKTSREKTPDNSEIIRNLVSDPALDEKMQHDRQHNAASEKKSGYAEAQLQEQSKRNIKAEKNTRRISTATQSLSIQKTKKSDPVGESLDSAWLAYEGGQYDEAKTLYGKVLKIEENNRDALLGLGAIAVIEKNTSMARVVYQSLLKQDPRDPIATAALASLHSNESSLKSDEEYLLSMLQKNPDAPHLNFALANVYAQQNKWKAAQQYYFNAWQHDNENADYVFNLAVSMDQLSKKQQAINFYKESLLKAANKQISFSRESVKKRIKELSGL
jgi:tetratricopeptide (TPR) repeat protein